ncbi:MAG: helix-turn-helix domain-containing protein [Verrucomicrobiae bacterium]|nr:helix-turn-helix domain-containing protein [Verrucomicrobiae bacterium]
MKHRSIPQFGMSRVGPEGLRQQGVVVVPLMESVIRDPQRLEPHYHEFFQILLLQGRAAVMHDFVEFEVEGVTLVFLSPGQIHTARPARGLRGTAVSFTQALFDQQSPPPSPLLAFPFFYPTDVRPWLTIPAREAKGIVEVFAELQREFDAAELGAVEILRAMLHILLVRAQRHYEKAHPPQVATRAARLLRQFHLAVEQRFRETQAVPKYARLLGVTANHLHDLVREQTGRSAGQVIRERRLLDAKRLLSHSALSVSEIGYHLGFQDPSYFTRFFRRSVGLTPAEFRGKIREKYQPKAGECHSCHLRAGGARRRLRAHANGNDRGD